MSCSRAATLTESPSAVNTVWPRKPMSPTMTSPAWMPMPYWTGSLHLGGELVVQMGDVRRDQRGGPQRLPAGGRRIGVEPEQRQHAVADELVGLAAGVGHRARHRVDKAVDQEHDVEGQARLRQAGRAAHVDEHADDVALLADIDALAVAHEIGADVGRQHRDDRDVGLRPQLAGEPDRGIAAGADARQHESLASGRPRQRAPVADDAYAAGRAARAAAADAGVRNVVAQACAQLGAFRSIGRTRSRRLRHLPQQALQHRDKDRDDLHFLTPRSTKRR